MAPRLAVPMQTAKENRTPWPWVWLSVHGFRVRRSGVGFGVPLKNLFQRHAEHLRHAERRLQGR